MHIRDPKYNFRQLPLPEKCCQNCDHYFGDLSWRWRCEETGIEEKVEVTNPERYLCDFWIPFVPREGDPEYKA